jgi:hypothetical protein
MGILDEAIREHLELKRQHGADDSELKQIEDQAFGPAERPGSEESAPDAAAEAPTQFMAQSETDAEKPSEDDSAEAPEPPPPARREPAAGLTDIQELPEQVEEEPEAEQEQPAEEEQPAGEHAVPDSAVEPTTEERHAIADQPTEMYDVEEEFAPAGGGEASDDELVAEEIVEPRLGPADPVAIPDADAVEEDEEEEDDFFDEKRLSDELDQALEAPVEPARESESESEEIETGPAEEDGPEDEHIDEGEHDEDVLEETPDFLEEAPEDDQLWFEQKPPKDFDFDD